jgi:hypothetical protein
MSIKVRGIILHNTAVFYGVLFINKCLNNMSIKVRGIILHNTAIFYNVLFKFKCFNNLEIKTDKINVDTICT